MTTYNKNVSEPWFSLIKIGAKKVEGRLNKGDFAAMKKGDIIIFHNNDLGYPRSVTCKVTAIKNYNTFEEYLQAEKLARCLPGVESIEEGVGIYHKYFTKQDELKYHVRAIQVRKPL